MRDSEFGKVRVHFYLWDSIEVRQLRRMLGRHMAHPDVVRLVEQLVRVFPPEEILPDPDSFRSQPGTVVKEAVRVLVGLPIPHDYTLLEVANSFHPRVNRDTGELAPFRLAFGFVTELSDQIPFERGYELWSDRIALRHYEAGKPQHEWRRQTRGEILHGLERALSVRLDALGHVVRALQQSHGERLTLRKPPFSAAPPVQMRVPEPARKLNALEQLDIACHEIDNRMVRGLPVEEREARFHSIRGLQRIPEGQEAARLQSLRDSQPRLGGRELFVFEFSPLSRDARIREREFTVVLSNEVNPAGDDNQPLDLDIPWRVLLGVGVERALEMVRESGLPDWATHLPLARLIGVEVVQFDATADPPTLVLTPNRSDLFAFAQELGLLDLEQPLILDPYFQDFESEQVERALRAIGGAAGQRIRR
jgi:hypothetical protein